jgi:hypothetical protein
MIRISNIVPNFFGFMSFLAAPFSNLIRPPTPIPIDRSSTPVTPIYIRPSEAGNTSPVFSPRPTKNPLPCFHDQPPSLASPRSDHSRKKEIDAIFQSMFKTLSGNTIAIDKTKLELITLIKEGKKGLKEKSYFVYRTPLVNSAQNTPFPCIKESKTGFKQYLLFEPKLFPITTRSPFDAKKLDFHSRAADHKLALKCIRVVSSVVSGLNPDEGQFPSGYGLKVEYDSRFLTPYAEGGDVLCFLNSNRRNLTLDDRSSLGLKILKKFAALHRIGIIHRDIKPENILMRRGEPFICDFGFSEKEGVSLKSCGSRKFIPPEYRPKAFLGKSLRLKNAPEDREPFSVKQIDLYTLGSTLFTLLADRFLDDALKLHLDNYVPPYYLDEWDDKEFSAFQDFRKEFVQDAINHFLEPYPQSVIEIIQGLTALSPKERMPLKTAIEKWEQHKQSD